MLLHGLPHIRYCPINAFLMVYWEWWFKTQLLLCKFLIKPLDISHFHGRYFRIPQGALGGLNSPPHSVLPALPLTSPPLIPYTPAPLAALRFSESSRFFRVRDFTCIFSFLEAFLFSPSFIQLAPVYQTEFRFLQVASLTFHSESGPL